MSFFTVEKKKKKKMEFMRIEEPIRKGPWKVDEDEVLINHIKKYGPTDWSSIRTKGLLQRTGKILPPPGCTFTQEEERIVIELQREYGNKWAKIATHLRGRTDNDVKNFWSSRQKRLARILHNSATSSSSSSNAKPVKTKREVKLDVSPVQDFLPPEV
ncbi:transcription factor DUO1-like [Rutidosis leptorrhynchoides]|uniref:transcription factor DUO1-like n=1 Tax=Rutidosis leptorrhynchoides TaxID=125765 RepID=UPI003A98E0E6